MGSTYKELKKSFGKYAVPNMLKELCDYWDENPYFFAGSIEIQPDDYNTVKDWFGDIEEGYSKVLPFAIDGAGSMIGFWLYGDGMTPDSAPVIFLSSEGSGSTVLADNISDYMVMLTANRDYIPFDGEFYDYEEEQKEESDEYRKWLKSKFDLDPVDDPDPLWKRAKLRHPNFEEWAESL
jgi:hypothetical protein